MSRSEFETEEFLLYRLPTVGRRVSRICEAEYAAEFGLKVTEWRLMAQVYRFGPISGKDVSERIALDPVAISRAAFSCVSQGLIQEIPDTSDRRSKRFTLTTAGKAFMKRFEPRASDLAKRMESGLTASEARTLKVLLKKLEATLSQMSPPMRGDVDAA